MNDIKTVGVAGSGTMGAGIAIVAARAGFRTIIFDTREEALARSSLPRKRGKVGEGARRRSRIDEAIPYRSIRLRPMNWRWIWLVPSQICVILASRISRSTRYSLQ